MKLWEIARFEVANQIRRPWPWLVAAILVLFAFQVKRQTDYLSVYATWAAVVVIVFPPLFG